LKDFLAAPILRKEWPRQAKGCDVNSSETVDLLKENLSVRQREEEGFRRWFVNSYFELIVWYRSKGGEFYGFQLCLSRNNFERAFTWTTDYVSSHKVSESYVETGISNLSTGILKEDGDTIPEEEVERFSREAQSLEPDLRELILDRIRTYNQKRKRQQ
jgi:hypothetical protein